MPFYRLGIFGRFKPNEVLTPGILWVALKELFLAEEEGGSRRPGTEQIVVFTVADRGGACSEASLSGP